jgi:ABC-type uncharacterized transport system substrate-binding protein
MNQHPIVQTISMKTRALLITFLTGIFLPLSIGAHPHNWIDLHIEVRFNNDGLVTGLYQQWLFDDYYSVFITEGMDSDGDGKPDRSQLQALRKTIFRNLKNYNFFTHIAREEQNTPFAPVSQTKIAMRGHRLEIRFFLPFETPHNPRVKPLTYQIFDPSYYIEMLHAQTKDSIVFRNAPQGCIHRIKRPTPDPEKVAYAASLPAGQRGNNDLGQFFAENVTIKCPVKKP